MDRSSGVNLRYFLYSSLRVISDQTNGSEQMLAFAAKLATRFDLKPEAQLAVAMLPGSQQRFAPGSIISSEHEVTDCVGIVVSGFASRFKIVNRRNRQITGFMLPGDAHDISSVFIGRPSSHLIANVETEVFWVGNDDLRYLCSTQPQIATSLWLHTLIDAGITQEWLANIGRRQARDRIAHLFLEMAARLESNGALIDDTFELPIKQIELASALGLSLVHTNKSLRSLDADGSISRTASSITLNDRAALAKRVGFDSGYLWLISEITGRLAAAMPLFASSHDPALH